MIKFFSALQWAIQLAEMLKSKGIAADVKFDPIVGQYAVEWEEAK